MVSSVGRPLAGRSSSGGTSTPGGMRCMRSASPPTPTARSRVYRLTVMLASACRAANPASAGLLPISFAWKYWTNGTRSTCLITAAAGLVTMCALRTTSGRKASAWCTAPALSDRIVSWRSARVVRPRRTSSPSLTPAVSTPGASRVTTRGRSRVVLLTTRWTSTWIPPGRGGKSGLRTRTRGSAIAALQAIEPQAEREHGPDDLGVIGGAGAVLAHHPRHGGPIEPSAVVDGAAVELLVEQRGQRAAQPVLAGPAARALGAPLVGRGHQGRADLAEHAP